MLCIGLCDMCVNGFGFGDEVSVTGTGGEGRDRRAPDVRGPMRSPPLSIATFLWDVLMLWLWLLCGFRISGLSLSGCRGGAFVSSQSGGHRG